MTTPEKSSKKDKKTKKKKKKNKGIEAFMEDAEEAAAYQQDTLDQNEETVKVDEKELKEDLEEITLIEHNDQDASDNEDE